MVTVFKADRQCSSLVSQKVEVPSERPMQEAVREVIEGWNSADFTISGSRVNVQDGVATVDLRVAPETKRRLNSLSSCEQLALLGGIRETLVKNPQWKIQDVEFTQQGKTLEF